MNKKVFISYAWGDKKHQEWIRNLGTRLMDNTIDVELDLWSLKDGHDVHEYMESMVKADNIFRVLIVCDKNYREKADNRNGGVGTETQIITPAIYSDQKQEKFIPLLLEKDDNNKPHLPIFLSSRKYIDFSSEEYFERSYEELLRNILEAPAIPKPNLGTMIPLYITESPTNNSKTSSIVRVLENQLKKAPEKANAYLSDFLEKFLDSLWDFEFRSDSRDILIYGEELLNNLLGYKILRDDFIDCILTVTKPEYNLDVEIIINFFEKFPNFKKPKNEAGGRNPNGYDNFKTIFHELFIYVIAISLKNKNYLLVSDLLHSKYYLVDNYGSKSTPVRFTNLYSYHENLENFYSQKFRKITGFGEYAISNLNAKINKDEFILADTVCHYIAELFNNGDYLDKWFPATYIYKSRYDNFQFFEKLSSFRHFEKVKSIYDIQSSEELQKLLNDYKDLKKGEQRITYGRGGFESIPFVFESIEINDISKNR